MENNKERQNTCIYAYKQQDIDRLIKRNEEEHFWTSKTLGEIIIDKLLEERRKYNKDKEDEKNMNKFIKLIINSIYGDLVSPYFAAANTIVGNNITARARSMAWYMEKGLNGFQTITDGCCFEINKIPEIHRYKVSSEKLINLDKAIRKRQMKLKTLMSTKARIDMERKEVIKDYSNEEIAKAAKNHLIELFAGVQVIKLYELEVQDICTHIITHGASNYQLRNFGTVLKTKMRGHRDQDYDVYNKEPINPVSDLFNSLYKNQEGIDRVKPVIERRIIGIQDYKQKQQRYEEYGLVPGNTMYITKQILESTISTYTFKTNEQREKWKHQYEKVKQEYGQTYESDYITENGKLNYKKMIEETKRKIENGDKKYNYTRKEYHPYKRQREDDERRIQKEILESTNRTEQINIKTKIQI